MHTATCGGGLSGAAYLRVAFAVDKTHIMAPRKYTHASLFFSWWVSSLFSITQNAQQMCA